MGWFSHKNKETAAEAEGAYVARAEDVSGAGGAAAARGRGKRGGSAKMPTEPVDPVLPEKKRARRRLVGAVALVLAVVIGLPMVLDSEPKPLAGDIAIQIPSKDKPYVTSDAPRAVASVPVAQSLDEKEELVDSGQAAGKAASRPVKPETRAEVKPEIKAEVKPEVKPDVKADIKPEVKAGIKPDAGKEAKSDAKPDVKHDAKAEAKPETKPKAESKAESKPESKPESRPAVKPEPEIRQAAKPEKPQKPADNSDSAQRAKAILDGGAETKSGKFVVQVAALATQEKIDELQDKLRGAGIVSHTQKVATESGNRTRIRVGPFADKDEALKMREKLVKLGLNGTLIPQ